MIILTIEPSRAPSRIRAKSLSASEVEVSWKPLPWSTSRTRIMGYEVRTTQLKKALLYIIVMLVHSLCSYNNSHSIASVLNIVTTYKQCYKDEAIFWGKQGKIFGLG